MKKIITLTLVLTVFMSITANAQTFGGGQTIIGSSNVAAQVSTGVYLTNTLYAYNPQRSLVLSGVNTNETVIGWYSFQVPTNYTLLAGTGTNGIPAQYISSMFTNSLAGWTNGTTYTTNISAISTAVNLPGFMGLNIGNNTNTAIVIP
jgi:hypothetical protein